MSDLVRRPGRKTPTADSARRLRPGTPMVPSYTVGDLSWNGCFLCCHEGRRVGRVRFRAFPSKAFRPLSPAFEGSYENAPKPPCPRQHGKLAGRVGALGVNGGTRWPWSGGLG